MSEPLRVLQVIGSMNCGGAEAMLMNLYRNIDRSKVQFDFLVCNKDRAFYDDEIESLGGRIYRELEYINPSNLISYRAICESFFSKHNYKIVHCHIGSIAWFVLSVAKKYGAFTITHSHSTYAGLGNLPYRLLSYPVRYTADYFFGCSFQAGKDRYGARTVRKADRFSVFKNAVNMSDFSFKPSVREQYRKELDLADNFTVGIIARVSKEKNHSFLFEAFSRIVKQDSSAVLLVVGDGVLRDEAQLSVEQMGISDNVRFLGVRSDVKDLLNCLDLFVMPSLYEGLPVSVIEAQVNGLPCLLSTNVPEESAVTDLVSFLPIDSADKWAQAILSYKGTPRADRSEEIRRAGYDIADNAAKLCDFYLSHI